MNDSSVAGFLTPISVFVAEDDALAKLLQQFVVGVTNLPGTLVRPRWQPQPPPQPPATTNWVSIGVTDTEVTDYPMQYHEGALNGGNGQTTFSRQEKMVVSTSCYGPFARGYASLIRDSMYIDQNLDMLIPYGIQLFGVEDIVTTSELVNSQWINRCDLRVSFVRMINRDYAILNINSAEVDLQYESNDASGTEVVLVNPIG